MKTDKLYGEILDKCLELTDEIIKASMIDMKKAFGNVPEQSIKVAAVCSILDFIVAKQKLDPVQIYDYCLTVAKMEYKHE